MLDDQVKQYTEPTKSPGTFRPYASLVGLTQCYVTLNRLPLPLTSLGSVVVNLLLCIQNLLDSMVIRYDITTLEHAVTCCNMHV